MTDAETYLTRLDGDAGTNWLTVGGVLSALEHRSRAGPAGKLWQDIVQERLEKAGHPVSTGHLYKIRRAYQVLEELAPEAVRQEPPPRISSIEIAERLHRLDPQAGKQALQDALGPKPASYVSLKKRYDEALEANPELKSARHIAWERRKPDGSPPESGDRAETSSGGKSIQMGAEPLSVVPQLPDDIQRASDELTKKTWNVAWTMAKHQSETQINELQQDVLSLRKELDLTKEENGMLQEEIDILARKVRELRGNYPEDFEDD